jgi:hypothetical protein
VEDGSEIAVVQHRSKNTGFRREAVEFDSSYRFQSKLPVSVQIQQPVTYMTSIESLKKKSQQLPQAAPSNPIPTLVSSDSYNNNLAMSAFKTSNNEASG